MNEIESMRYFQALYDRFADKPGEVYWVRVHNQTTREAIETALTALREKAERDKGCEYCNPNPYGHGEAIKPLIRQVFNDKAQICTKISGDGLHTLAVPSSEDTSLAKRYSKCQIINYCPMCGKRLEVEQYENSL